MGNRRIANFFADLLDKIRQPGWPRRIAFLVGILVVMLIPYPLSITGDFEVISLRPLMVRNLVEGTLTEITVKMGDEVKEGQVVARLLDVELKLEKAKVKAQLNEAQAQLQLTQKGFRKEEIDIARFRLEELRAAVALNAANLKRETALYRAKAIAKARLDQARSEYVQSKKSYDQAEQELKKLNTGFREEEIAQAAARVDQLKGQLQANEQHIAWTELKAPISGRIITPDADMQKLVGTFLARGTPVLQIVEARDLVARVGVPESEFGDVKLGQEVALRSFQYPNSSFRGFVDKIEPLVEDVDKFRSEISVITRIDDPKWNLLRVHTKGKAKIGLGYSPLGYVLYRRVLRSTFVKVWSWY